MNHRAILEDIKNAPHEAKALREWFLSDDGCSWETFNAFMDPEFGDKNFIPTHEIPDYVSELAEYCAIMGCEHSTVKTIHGAEFDGVRRDKSWSFFDIMSGTVRIKFADGTRCLDCGRVMRDGVWGWT